MLLLAIALFIAAAVCGLILLTAILQDKPVNKAAKNLHGIFAAVGIILVLVYVFIFMPSRSPLLVTSSILLVLAALGGLTLFILGMKKKKIPKLAAVIHPLIAFAGLLALIIYVLP
ncbi:Uncharacterised protein [Legionella sainthelensi]|uniref:Uncharacterized protein n=1 Tax=Legionella sainthelensi TaxID=28087 RepID=A0A2H5FKF1_9GAMM|nr:hypothetical protein [Legionella sainthelensi]AUH72041.1 hypothetical protein CAB17_08180 [Legionella sainthelensi]VEB34109.1 Uncharacterised protein [Legionella sainthelensi]